jgi:hypothetical protein
MYVWLLRNYSEKKANRKEKIVSIYDDELLEQKLEVISNQMGHLLMDILLLSLKRLGNDNQTYTEFMEAKMEDDERNNPF